MKAFVTRLVLLAMVLAALGYGQIGAGATKEDWEEINFEFNSAVLTDGFPSLLRLADMLSKNPDFRVKLDGHTDSIGGEKYNEKLSQKRAEAVRGFLEKYGTRPAQMEIVPRGKRNPKAENTSKEGRWVNRRVALTVTDKNGKVIGVGGVGDAIKALQAHCPDYSQTLAEILKRLDKLDDIARMLAALTAENAKLRTDVDALKGAQTGTQAVVAALPKAATAEDVQRITQKTADDTLAKSILPRFSILGANVGVDNTRNLTFTGRARYFAPFREKFAIQAQGEYMYFKERQEAQFDLGIVNRFSRRGQIGAFSSFKHVGLADMQNGATLGQAAITADYIFSRGRVGVFGTKAFLSGGVINKAIITRNIYEESYLRVVDQAGASTSVNLFGNLVLEGNVGMLAVQGGENKPGGTIRFIQPINKHVAFTLEGGFNETYVSRSANGRVVAGLQFGNFIQPKQYLEMESPIPVDVPRVRYEMLTRRVRTGNDAPIADAGQDQNGVAAGQVTLDGSASFDPEGDAITYQWDQIAGSAVNLSGRNTAKATFTAAEGQTYSFRLTVKDSFGLASLARVSVTAKANLKVVIQKFTASPTQIKTGGSSTLTWQVQNADEVEITTLGKVNPQSGTSQVSPTETTAYKLTARNKEGELSETVTVTVDRPVIRIISFRAAPTSIKPGDTANLVWETENADTVSISGIGNVQPTGTASVSPRDTTTYTMTATGKGGTVTATVTVSVTSEPVVPGPKILSFGASPTEILAGESSTLSWSVDGAKEISITALGAVAASGSTSVMPTVTTTYVLTAKNEGGEVKANVTVTVVPLARIVSFLASPSASAKPGDVVRLTWSTTDAQQVSINGIGTVTPNGSVDVTPSVDTTYTLVVQGKKNTVSSSVTVTVKQPDKPVPPVGGKAPVIRLNIPDRYTTTSLALALDASASTDPQGDALKFEWTQEGGFDNGLVDIQRRYSADTTVFLPNKAGDYVVQVKVTNQRGLSSTKLVTLTLLKP
ncbi:MAG: OmpA family protein [Bryobacterales bacterium]|nr:OmpA family protein [Bryobacterales bacterium]